MPWAQDPGTSYVFLLSLLDQQESAVPRWEGSFMDNLVIHVLKTLYLALCFSSQYETLIQIGWAGFHFLFSLLYTFLKSISDFGSKTSLMAFKILKYD